MTAKEMIEYLKSVPEETPITLWVGGLRYQVHEVDPFDYWDGENPSVDINASLVPEEGE